MLEDIVPRLRARGVKVVSLHGHTSSSDRAVANYALITNQMIEVCEYFDFKNLRFFDVGGGFFGAAADGIDTSGKPRYDDYAECIINRCKQSDWFRAIQPTIVIEPGVSVVANVFSYVSQIFQKKEITGQEFLTTDGTVFDVKPTLHSNNLPYTFFTSKSSHGTYKANLVGSTCMEKDVILNGIEVPDSVGYGDYVKIDGVGAYTISLTPTFINYLSPIFDVKDLRMVRRRQSINDIVSLYNLE